ncbi:MAG: hypothetical protein PHG00_16330 [Methylococcales bacterium]|nr:hypothetical protein [Methylococcales bacterium]
MTNELFVIVAKGKYGDMVLTPELSLADAKAKLNVIQRFRKSSRIERADYAMPITRFDEVGEEALMLICRILTEIEGGFLVDAWRGCDGTLEDVLNQLFELVVLMGIDHQRATPKAAN